MEESLASTEASCSDDGVSVCVCVCVCVCVWGGGGGGGVSGGWGVGGMRGHLSDLDLDPRQESKDLRTQPHVSSSVWPQLVSST